MLPKRPVRRIAASSNRRGEFFARLWRSMVNGHGNQAYAGQCRNDAVEGPTMEDLPVLKIPNNAESSCSMPNSSYACIGGITKTTLFCNVLFTFFCGALGDVGRSSFLGSQWFGVRCGSVGSGLFDYGSRACGNRKFRHQLERRPGRRSVGGITACGYLELRCCGTVLSFPNLDAVASTRKQSNDYNPSIFLTSLAITKEQNTKEKTERESRSGGKYRC